MKRIMILAGGTGGHVFPGLVISLRLMYYGWKVRWIGTAHNIEANLVPKYNIDIKYINIYGIVGKGFKKNIFSIFYIGLAVLQARRIMQKWLPDVTLGMGGFVSAPSGLASWSMGIPLIIHEQNAIAGVTNRTLNKIACKSLQAFPEVLSKAEVVGNPIREEILSLSTPTERLSYRNGPIKILVLGGSQGSKILNDIIPIVSMKTYDKFIFLHQVGFVELERVREIYAMSSYVKHKVVDFIYDMSHAYAWADMVICRSGALTVSEISAVGLAAIFVPFLHLDNHQYLNALPLQQIGAAKIINESKFTVEYLVEFLVTLDRQILIDMGCKARTLCIRDSTERIICAISSLC